MNNTLNGIVSTMPEIKPVVWNVNKIHAAICILLSAAVSIGLIAWGAYAFL